MPVDQMVEAHAATTRLDIHELVRRLNGHLGATAVAALSGSRDSKAPYKWANGTREPSDEAARRLRAAHRAWKLIADADSDHIARTWFMGANPLLDEVSPVLVLRSGDEKAVLEAARAFVRGAWHD